MEWSNELVFEFLDLYEREEGLWNPKSPDHKNKLRVAECWENIRRGLSIEKDMSVNALKKKKDSLMATYRNLHSRVVMQQQQQQSKKPGSRHNNNEEVYRPSWFCYDRMNVFLQDVYKPKQIENCDTDTENGIMIDDDESDLNEAVDNNLEATTSSKNHSKKPFNSSSRWKSSRSEVKIAKRRMDEAYAMLKSVSQRVQNKKDECDIYGELIAIKLKKMDERTRDIVMNNIDNLIFRAKMDGRGHRHQYQYVQETNQQQEPLTTTSTSGIELHPLIHPSNIKSSPNQSFQPSPSHSHLSHTSIGIHSETHSPYPEGNSNDEYES